MKIKLSEPISSLEITFATGAKFNGEKRIFTHLSTSSCDADENTVFFALQGKRTSGEEYVRDLNQRKICSVSKQVGENIFTHSSPLVALLKLAKYYKSKLKKLKHTIAITGSVGKTTTKEFLLCILKEKWTAYANVGNLNSEIGVPLTILSTPLDCEILILEFGMNHRGEIKRLSECALPDYALITNIGHAHIGNLGSREAIASEKMDVCAVNPDIPVLVDGKEPLLSPLKNKIALARDITFHRPSHDTLDIRYREREFHLHLSPLSYDTEQCLMFALSMGIVIGTEEAVLQKGLDNCHNIPQRRKEIRINGFKIIDDTYNASPESMTAAISFMKELKARRRFAVIGDMLELGDYTRELHIELGRMLADGTFDKIYLFGEFGKYTEEGLLDGRFNQENIYLFDDIRNCEGLICALSSQLKRGDACLLKGSNGAKMWRITEGLEEIFAK